MSAIERPTAILTGGTGYIGQRLARQLHASGWALTLVVRSSSMDKARAALPSLADDAFIAYNGSPDSLSPLCSRTQANPVVFHLASHIDTGKALDTLDALVDVNIRLGTHLLGHMMAQGLRNIVVAESYWQFSPNGRLGGNTFYAASKSAFSLLLRHAVQQGIRTSALVLYDVYGPGDTRGKLLDQLIASARQQIPLVLTPGEQVMDYVYIDDVVDAFQAAGTALAGSQTTTGSFQRHTVRSMDARPLKAFITTLAGLIGSAPPVIYGGRPYPPHQILQPWLPPASRQTPGWHPRHDFDTGIRKILADA